MHHGRTKHIEIRYHFIREKVTEGKIKLEFVPTKDEAADGLTKPLAGEAFTKFLKELGLEQVWYIGTTMDMLWSVLIEGSVVSQ